jgi:hypothetical protein
MISVICQDISEQIGHAIVRYDIAYSPEKAKTYKNDKNCVNEFYKFACLGIVSQPLVSQGAHGILKKPGEKHGDGQEHHAGFEEDKVVEEQDNDKTVMARWLADTFKTFFEAKHSIILVPTTE